MFCVVPFVATLVFRRMKASFLSRRASRRTLHPLRQKRDRSNFDESMIG
jgi:hypothetical protein